MCTRAECIDRLTRATPYIRSEFGVKSMCLFGSVARGDNMPESDIDIFVDMPPKMFKVIGLKQFLEDLLGKAVDVVRKQSQLNDFFLKQIERDAVTIFT